MIANVSGMVASEQTIVHPGGLHVSLQGVLRHGPTIKQRVSDIRHLHIGGYFVAVASNMMRLSKPLAGVLGFALIWAVAAVVSPTTTFHLGPVIVAVSPVLFSDHRPATRVIAAGLGIAVAISFALAASGSLHGPTLLPWGGALAESLVFAAVGAIVSLAIGTRRSAPVPT
jgi:hypothetical protein